MTRIVADISVSIDGFVTGPNVSLTNGMGDGGMALHAWAFGNDPDDQRMLTEGMERSGAVMQGRNLFDIIDGPDGWSDEVGYGAEEVGRPPFVVLTSSKPDSLRLKELDWTFVTTGLADAIDAARERAGGKDVVLMGGGQIIRSAVEAGLVDVLVLHLAPVILGSGTPLFTGGAPRTFVQKEVVVTPNATHLVYEAQ